MLILRKNIEEKIERIIINFYNYNYSIREIEQKKTDYYFLIADLKKFKKNGGSLELLKIEFLLPFLKKRNLKDEQKDFIYDLIDSIEGNCTEDELL